MGAENSYMKSISISDKQLVEKLRNDLLLYEGKSSNDHKKISIFEDGNTSQNAFKDYFLDRPLVRAVRNLKIYRHPYSILKFLGTTSEKNLLTEFVYGTLEKNLSTQNDIMILCGIKNILNGLIFLVETANVRHLNVCAESIFITENSTWKLHGMEHVFKSADITEEFLQKSRPYRNQLAIDPNEDGVGLEQYAFATLCEAVIKKESKIPYAQEFLAYCQKHLKHKNSSLRPLLSAVQLHDFFNHDFVQIHNFLTELSLKTQPAKLEFFKTLPEKLKQFDENVIGSQLSDLLLSRLVLLDQSAQYYFIPFLLKPQNLEDDEENSTDEYLFTTAAFIKYVVPKLKQVFRVLDVQIRLVLLEHFHLYVNTFSKEELTDIILPQLLLGIKDTNDLLVTKTLLCLCELIPILGASLVVCKNRRKIFADGRPQQTEMWINNVDQPRSITPVINSSIDILSSSPANMSEGSLKDDSSNLILGNGNISDNNATDTVIENEISDNELTDTEIMEARSEWDWNQDAVESAEIIEEKVHTSPLALNLQDKEKDVKPTTASRPKIDDNISMLDIKNKKLTKLEEQTEDFFNDFKMTSTPCFQKTNIIIDEKEVSSSASEIKIESSRLQMSKCDTENICWDDDNWGDEEEL